jgi:hypothetical protein
MSAQFRRPIFQLTVEWAGQRIELSENACHERLMDAHISRPSSAKVPIESLQLYFPYYGLRKS